VAEVMRFVLFKRDQTSGCPHLAGGAHQDRHQELPPARAPGARHQRGPGQARRHLQLRDEGAPEEA
jgi:hypothetical protein